MSSSKMAIEEKKGKVDDNISVTSEESINYDEPFLREFYIWQFDEKKVQKRNRAHVCQSDHFVKLIKTSICKFL